MYYVLYYPKTCRWNVILHSRCWRAKSSSGRDYIFMPVPDNRVFSPSFWAGQLWSRSHQKRLPTTVLCYDWPGSLDPQYMANHAWPDRASWPFYPWLLYTRLQWYANRCTGVASLCIIVHLLMTIIGLLSVGLHWKLDWLIPGSYKWRTAPYPAYNLWYAYHGYLYSIITRHAMVI